MSRNNAVADSHALFPSETRDGTDRIIYESVENPDLHDQTRQQTFIANWLAASRRAKQSLIRQHRAQPPANAVLSP